MHRLFENCQCTYASNGRTHVSATILRLSSVSLAIQLWNAPPLVYASYYNLRSSICSFEQTVFCVVLHVYNKSIRLVCLFTNLHRSVTTLFSTDLMRPRCSPECILCASLLLFSSNHLSPWLLYYFLIACSGFCLPYFWVTNVQYPLYIFVSCLAHSVYRSHLTRSIACMKFDDWKPKSLFKR